MIRSAKPSPFTSPADATEVPLRSFADRPLILKPLPPSSDESAISAAKPDALPNST